MAEASVQVNLPVSSGAKVKTFESVDSHGDTVESQAATLVTGAGVEISPATEATLASRLADATFTGRINTQGQKTMAASTPVVIASDQAAVPVSGPADKTVLGTLGVLAATVTIATSGYGAVGYQTTVTGGVPFVGTIVAEQSCDGGVNWEFINQVFTNNVFSGNLTTLVLDSFGSPGSVNTGDFRPGASATHVRLRVFAYTSGSIDAQLNGTAIKTGYLTVTGAGSSGEVVVKAAQLPASLVGARLDTNNGAWLGSTAPTVGQKTMANSVPVALASDQSSIPVAGTVAHDAPVSGNPVLVAGRANATAPADVSADGDAVDAWRLRNGAAAAVLTAAGALIGGDAANGLDVDITRLPAGMNPAALGQGTMAQSVRVVLPSDQTAVPVSGPLTDTQLRATAVPVSGPLTDTQLRATAVPVSGPLTDTQLRASVVPVGDGAGSLTVDSPGIPTALGAAAMAASMPVTIANNQTAVPVSGPLTDTQLRATAVPVSGPLTDTQLRATAVPVSGPLTDTQLRASVVPVGDGAGSLTVDSPGIPTTLGQKTMANSLGVVLASDQASIPVAATIVLVASALANGVETAVSNAAVQVAAANAARKSLTVQNTGLANIRIGVAGVAATTGIRLVPGGTVTFDSPYLHTGAVFAIREGATDSIALAQEVA